MQIFEKKVSAAPELPAMESPAAAGIPPWLCTLLYARGARDEAAMHAFLQPDSSALADPYLFTDMEAAVDCLRRAVAENTPICIFGDYDADGVCATAILLLCLRALGADVHYYIPSRHEEGYGMTIAAVEKLAAEGVELIVTVDNGVKANAEAQRCYELSMRLLITDHHLCGETLPRAEAILCHTRADDAYPNPDICGAGTAYKLARALAGEAADAYLPLAGVATIADVVPLLGENRVLAAEAIQRLRERRCPLGLAALWDTLGRSAPCTAYDIAFGIAPRLNAAGRIADAALAVELLCSEDAEACKAMAEQLCLCNDARRSEESAICAEAEAQLAEADLTERFSIVLKGDWNSGVIGIAAGRIAEKYYRPTILFSEKDGMLTASARSIPGVPLYAALLRCAQLLTRFGGHAHAAGASMRLENFPAFCEAFEAAVREEAPIQALIPRAYYELELPPDSVNLGLAAQLERLAPFGEGNPYPTLYTRRAYLRGLRRMGQEGRHLKGTIYAGASAWPCVFFGMGARMEELLRMDRCEALYTLDVDEWNGAKKLQLQLRAVRPGAPEGADAYLSAHRAKFVDAFSRNILYNSYYGGICCPRVEPDAYLRAALQRRVMGLLVLCFTPVGAARLLHTEGLYEQMDVTFFREPPGNCAYNAAVLAPVLADMQPWRYREILVYDTPLCDGVLQKLRTLAPQADICMGDGDGAELMASLSMDRGVMAALYRAFRGAQKRFYNRAELARYLAGRTKLSERQCALGTDILLELGFARENNGIEFVSDVKAPLQNSKTFRALQALEGNMGGNTMDLKQAIRNIPDFPKPGILFYDITTLIKDKTAYHQLIADMAASLADKQVDIVVGPEARGFVIGSALAYALGAGFVLARKPGKLPCDTISYEYALEYGTDSLEIHTDAIQPGVKVVLVDDLLATGGTALAAIRLIEQAGGEVVGARFGIELEDLGGREALKGYDVDAVIKYEH